MPIDPSQIKWDQPAPIDHSKVVWDDAPKPMTAGDVASGAAKNFIPSAINLGKSIYSTVRHPVDTAAGLYHLGAGIVEKALPGEQADEATPNAVGKFFADRYGGLENVKHTMAEDPAGFMADASILLGGGSAALRAAGAGGKAANLAAKLGTVTNPLTLPVKAVSGVAKLGGNALAEALGVTTGAGGQSIRTAFGAGMAGGPKAAALADNMRGNVPLDQVVSDARGALAQVRKQRGTEYRAGMGGVNADRTVLDLSPVDAAIAQTGDVNNFKGIDLAPKTADVRQQIGDLVETWKQQSPQDFHTAEGLDALKKGIGNIRDTTQYGSPDRVVADAAYNAVKAEIVRQAPEYAQVMGKYADASDHLSDLTKTLSLGQNAATDTTLRKLQSVLRDNVNTSYGQRLELAKSLAANGAPNLLESLSGQALSSPTARGLGKALTGGELGGGITALALGHPAIAAATIPAMLAQSPRLVGEAALASGKAAKLAKALGVKQKDAAKAGLLAELLGRNQAQPAH